MKTREFALPLKAGLLAVTLCMTAMGSAGSPTPQSRIINPPRLEVLQRRLSLYELGEQRIDEEMLRKVGTGLKLHSGKRELTFEDEGGSVRAALMREQTPRIVFHADLSKVGLRAPMREEAVKIAQDFVRQYELVPVDQAKLGVHEVTTLSRNIASGRNAGQSEDILKTVRFTRRLDGIRVCGPSSVLALHVSSSGVEGLTNSLRPVQKSNVTVQTRTEDDMMKELTDMIAKSPAVGRGKPRIVSREIVYLEQGLRYVQPVLLAGVEFNGPNGIKTGTYFAVPAIQNSPERIIEHEPMGGPNPDSVKPRGRERAQTLMWTAPAPLQANPVQIGMYVVKQDDQCWVNDANAFWSNVSASNALPFWPKKNLAQYYWDEVWMWYASGSIPDNSMWFPGQVHLALVEGHGAPWEITCFKNYGEIIHLNQIKGFGANRGYGEKTAYVIWHSCDVVPAPGDPYGGDYTSGSPFDVWWGMFKGMRGTYGYRTTMYICDGVGGLFGNSIGYGLPMLSSWLSATDHNIFGHQNGWDYGSAVIVSGHENDTLYTNSALPNPGSLTIWWTHP